MRYILPEEGAKTQSLPDNIELPMTKSGSFRVLGNMVNVELVYEVALSLLKNYSNKITDKTLEEAIS